MGRHDAPSAQRFNPDWTLAPGDLLREELKARNITQAELGRRMFYDRQVITRIINARQPLDPEFAIALEKQGFASAEFWVAAEAYYRLDLVRGRTRSIKP